MALYLVPSRPLGFGFSGVYPTAHSSHLPPAGQNQRRQGNTHLGVKRIAHPASLDMADSDGTEWLIVHGSG